jgi:hypothetical protein
MIKWAFVIGSMDDFSSIEALSDAYDKGTALDYNASVFHFELPAGRVGDFWEADLATLVGYGMAFENDWCADGTLSFVVRL